MKLMVENIDEVANQREEHNDTKMFQVEKTGEPDPRTWSGLPDNRRRTRHLLLSWSKP